MPKQNQDSEGTTSATVGVCREGWNFPWRSQDTDDVKSKASCLDRVHCHHVPLCRLEEDNISTSSYADNHHQDGPFAPLPWNLNKDTSDAILDDKETFTEFLVTLEIGSVGSVTCGVGGDDNMKRKVDTSINSVYRKSSSLSERNQQPLRKRRRRNKVKAKKASTVDCAILIGPNVGVSVQLHELLNKSMASQEAPQEFDRKNGLPRSHCQTMVDSSRSHKQLQSGLILLEWNRKLLLGLTSQLAKPSVDMVVATCWSKPSKERNHLCV